MFSDVIENDITIGPTQPADVIISVVSDGGIFARGFDEGKDVFLDATASVNYTHYWLAIFEEGPTFNRYRSQGWTFGQITSTINLREMWRQVHDDFKSGHEYIIQFALSNACNEFWTEPDHPQFFFICPSGLGCRYSEQNDEIRPNFTMFPNPVSDHLNIISDLEFNSEEYSLEIRDISGRITYSAQTLDNKTIETSNFPNGFYIAMISKNNQVILTKKIIVQR